MAAIQLLIGSIGIFQPLPNRQVLRGDFSTAEIICPFLKRDNFCDILTDDLQVHCLNFVNLLLGKSLLFKHVFNKLIVLLP